LLYAALLAVIVAIESPGPRGLLDRFRASRADGLPGFPPASDAELHETSHQPSTS
jgi:hypothetical protein